MISLMVAMGSMNCRGAMVMTLLSVGPAMIFSMAMAMTQLS